MRSELFAPEHMERQTQDQWALQSKKMLRVNMTQDIIATKGAMVAYQGQMLFRHEGSGTVGKFLKKALTNEDAPMMRVSGQGEVFFARQNRFIFLLLLEGEAITVNSSSLLAFDSSLSWDIRRVQGAGMLAGGLFNLELSGQGYVAICSDGDPMVLDASGQPTFVDPQAAVCWSANLAPSIKNDFNFSGMLRGGSGEAFQLAFHGPGFVVVQPSEGTPVVRAGG
ncbi:AIM24 family protein [Kocuria sp. ZOR0020]|uniref:AIM24 family protein n=1 Tax=Kocuria sp. ZOR0020 TaxID=1339234 RepID=UPI000646A419|nr:AIM24 family protein [Kocuria sp. ZOR0020]